MGVRGLRAFVPAKDFELSKRFYHALGFKTAWQGDDLALLEIDGHCIYLQNYHVKEWAENQMLFLDVEDLDQWWERIQSSGVLDMTDVRAKPPTDYPWGIREVHLVDPAGVCWHLANLSA